VKVILASTRPFVGGGASQIVEWLAVKLRSHHHQVEVLEFPFSFHYEEILEQMLAFRLLDLSQYGDRLIAVRTPSYLLQHPHKTVWFIHHYRSAYDLWRTQYCDIPKTPEGLRYRSAIMSADNAALREATRVFANSQVVTDRLKRFNGIDAEVLYPPLLDPESFHCAGFGDYLLYISRLTHHKRQLLAIEALLHTCTPVRLMIIGRPDPGAEAYADELSALVAKHRMDDRVVVAPHWISEKEKIALFADCLAAIYIPLDEDSYGYPTLEAYQSGKAVITAADSGGTGELIVDGINGLVTPAEPKAIARAMDQLYLDRDLARRMGEAGRNRIGELGITWDRVIERLLA